MSAETIRVTFHTLTRGTITADNGDVIGTGEYASQKKFGVGHAGSEWTVRTPAGEVAWTVAYASWRYSREQNV